MSPFEEYAERERSYLVKARQLIGDVHPAFNVAPILELIRQADALGFDIVRRPVLNSAAPK